MIKTAIKNRKIVFYFLFIIFVGGIYSYVTLPKQEAPDLNPPVTRITAVYPGASQNDVNEFVTKKIETSLMNMEEYDYSHSYTYNSITTIICFMKYGNDPDDLWVKLRREMNDLQETLPDEVMPLMVDTNLADTAGMIISLSGEGYDYETLGFYGERISEDLKTVDGVTKFEMIGDVGKEVKITVDAAEITAEGDFGDAIVEGPLALDVALSPEACAIKGLDSAVGGRADILVFPNIETGNVFYKASTLLAGARLAAAVVGTTAPCVLTSRADSEESKFLSIAMGCRLVK